MALNLKKKPIHKEIKFLRESKKITQASIAEKLGIALNNYGKIERGEIKLTVERLDTILGLLGLSLTQFFMGIENGSYGVEPKQRLNELELQNKSLKEQLEDKKKIIDLMQREIETTRTLETKKTRK